MALTNIETNIILDLYDHDLTPTKIKAIALDSNTRYVSAVIRDRGGVYDVGQNTSITLTVMRPDKVGVQIVGETVAHTETTPDEQTITTYGAYAELSQVALAIKGTLRAQFKLVSGEQVLRTEIFSINNGEALDATIEEWAGDIDGHNLDEMAQSIEDLSSDVSEIQEDVSDLKEGFSELPSVKESDAESDIFDITDSTGNVVMRLEKGHIQTKNFNSADFNRAHIITLKSDGSGDFATLRSAVDSITDADSETNPYEIHVYPGTYNTLEGYSDAEIRSADIGGGYTDQSMVGVKLTDGISLIGIGDAESIVLTAELDTASYPLSVRGNISTLNLKGTCRVENVTIKAKNLRYCVHDDFEYPKRYTRIMKDCILIPVGRALAYNPATTYGAGIRIAGCDALFENCDFGFNWGMHTRELMTGNSNVILRNCKGLTARIGDQSFASDNAHHTFYFDSCNFKSVSISRSVSSTPHVSVSGVNNSDIMTFCDDADNPQLADITKTYPSSIPIGTLVDVTVGGITATSGGITASVAQNIETAYGVLIGRDENFDFIQSKGYINAKRIGLTGLNLGEYVTIDGSMKLIGGGTKDNAVGIVKYTDNQDRSQILLKGGC